MSILAEYIRQIGYGDMNHYVRDESLDFSDRHTATQAALRWFEFGHLPEGGPRTVSAYCCSLAVTMVQELQDSAELTAGLRKLREAKDCFVFQAVMEKEGK